MLVDIARTLHKLRGRTPQELRERVEQKLAALAERAGLSEAGEPSDETFLARLASRARPVGIAPVVTAVRERPRARFFAGAEDPWETAALVRARWPERVAEIVRAAQEVSAGSFTLLGHPPLHISDPVDWHRDPIAGVRAPTGHWSTIPYLDPAAVGDHKLVWELSRQQYLVTLGQAYVLTRDEGFARRAVELLESWMDANPPKRGMNWASSLEVAYRAIAWIWAYRFIRRSRAFTPAVTLRLLKFLEVSARHVERYLSTYFSPNTHLTGEALGLLYIGTQFPELAGARRWTQRGWQILLGALPRHVREDGTYFEQATQYHRYTLDIYLHARVLGAAARLPGVERVDDALVRLATFLAWVARGEGTIPLFGDEDGGRLLFLDGRPGDDVRGVLATVAALTGRGEVALPGDATDEVAWTLGAAGLATWDRLPRPTPEGCARDFPDGGFYVMRDGWGPDASVLTVDCGALGADNGGHAHADTLAFDLSVRGAPIFVDAGTVTYTGDAATRDLLRDSAVHNTLTLDGESSSVAAGPFRWSVMTPGVADGWLATGAGAFFEGHHDGYARLESPARHRRVIVSSRDGWWVVRDEVEGEGRHAAAATFQCAAGLDLAIAGRALRVSDDGRVILTVRALDCMSAGAWRDEAGVASRRYGAPTEARRGRYEYGVSGNSAVSYAMTRGDVGDWEVAYERRGTTDVIRLRDRTHDDLLLFDASGTVEGVHTDARLAWVRRRMTDRTVESLMVIGGTVVEIDGATIVRPAGGAVTAVLAPDGWRVARVALLGVPAERPRNSKNT